MIAKDFNFMWSAVKESMGVRRVALPTLAASSEVNEKARTLCE